LRFRELLFKSGQVAANALATVPIVSIDKDRQALRRQDNVRSSGEFTIVELVSQPSRPKGPPEG